MEKLHAIELLGGSVTAVAKACGISPSAVSQWPDLLTKDQSDRVQAALWRRQQAGVAGGATTNPPEAVNAQA